MNEYELACSRLIDQNVDHSVIINDVTWNVTSFRTLASVKGAKLLCYDNLHQDNNGLRVLPASHFIGGRVNNGGLRILGIATRQA